MGEFFTGRPPTGAEEDEAIREMFRKDRRPTAEELKNFVVTPECWNRAMELYREPGSRQWTIDAAAKSRDKATSYRGFLVGSAAMGIEPNLPPKSRFSTIRVTSS